MSEIVCFLSSILESACPVLVQEQDMQILVYVFLSKFRPPGICTSRAGTRKGHADFMIFVDMPASSSGMSCSGTRTGHADLSFSCFDIAA